VSAIERDQKPDNSLKIHMGHPHKYGRLDFQPPENLPLFPHMPLEMNASVPQKIEAFEQERRALLRYLEDLHKKNKRPPIWLIEHKDCFTNIAMRRTLNDLLGGAEVFRKYVLPFTIDPSVYQYPIPEDDTIFILGGSVNDTYDHFGRDFTRRFSLPLLEQVQAQSRIRVLGICFGHQSLIEAYGMMLGIPIRTIKSAFQLGFYSVDFNGDHPGLRALKSQLSRGVAFTRSGYPKRMDDQPAADIPGLRVEAEFSAPLNYSDRNYCFIPPAVSYLPPSETMPGMVLTIQGHPEIDFKKRHMRPVIEFIHDMREKLTDIVQPVFPFEIPRRKRPKTISNAFFIPLLKHFAEELAR